MMNIKTMHLLLGIAIFMLVLPPVSYSVVPNLVNFQGKLYEDGEAVNGSRDMRFSLWETDSGGDCIDAIWCEDSATVDVVNGIYNVHLGGVAETLPDDLWTRDALFLQVEIEQTPGNWQILTPLLEVTSTIFAIKANIAEGVTEGAITTTMLSDFAVTSDKIAPGQITDVHLGDNAVGINNITTGAVGTDEIVDNSVASADIAVPLDLTASILTASVISGTNSSTAGMGLAGFASADNGITYGVYGHSESSDLNSFGGYFSGANGLFGFASTIDGVGVSGLQTGYDLADFPSVGKSGGFFGGSNGIVAISNAQWGKGVYAETTGENSYGVYGKVQSGTSSHAGYFQRGNIHTHTTAFEGDDVVLEDHDAVLGLYSSDGGSAGSAITLGEINDFGYLRNKWSAYRTTGASAQLRFTFGTDPSYANNPSALTLDDSGYVGVGTNSPDAKLVINGDGSSFEEGVLSIKNLNEDAGIRLYSSSIDIRHTIYNSSLFHMLRIAPAASASGGISMTQSGRVGIGTGLLPVSAALVVAGRTKTTELEITGGSDLSENFDISECEAEIKPGMVVSIDPATPGKLLLSGEAYDRKVAGIVSGAGGIGTGLLMGQKGSEADGAFPVALSGRVYCMADATHGPIQPGDLLTTADTPGHAMRVLDHSKAQGAILGKAMSSLDSGKGLVLVLVALQ